MAGRWLRADARGRAQIATQRTQAAGGALRPRIPGAIFELNEGEGPGDYRLLSLSCTASRWLWIAAGTLGPSLLKNSCCDSSSTLHSSGFTAIASRSDSVPISRPVRSSAPLD